MQDVDCWTKVKDTGVSAREHNNVLHLAIHAGCLLQNDRLLASVLLLVRHGCNDTDHTARIARTDPPNKGN